MSTPTGFEDIPIPTEPSLPDPFERLTDKAPTAPPVRRARVTLASDITPKPVVWAWRENGEGRIPAGSLSIAAGREGTGKSSWALWVAAQLTRGTLPGTFFGTPRMVFYVAVEDSWQHTLVPRLMATDADLTKVGRFDVVSSRDEEMTLSLPTDNDLLETAIREHRAAAVVIDPLMSVMGAGIDTHKERDVRSALDPLMKLAERTGVLVLGIAHFGKSAGSDISSLITGSGAFKNVPRAVFGFARDDSAGERVMTQSKNSLGRDDLPNLSYSIEAVDVPVGAGVANVGRFVFTGESDRSVEDILRDGRANDRDDSDAGSRSDAERFIIEYLQEEGGSAPAKEITAAGVKAGFAPQALTKARFKASTPSIKSERRGFGKGSVVTWSIDSSLDSIHSRVQTPESKESMPESVVPDPDALAQVFPFPGNQCAATDCTNTAGPDGLCFPCMADTEGGA